MHFKPFLESQEDKLVMVDIQPIYHSHCGWLWQNGLADFIKGHQEILILFVGPDLSSDTKSTVARYYFKNGLPKNLIYSMKWFNKGYAFFRDVMDSGCYMRNDIIKIIRFMLAHKVYDWRQFTDENIARFSRLNLTRDKLESMFMGIPDLAFILRKWAGAKVIGGGLDECLEEVMLLADAMKLNFQVAREYTY